MDKITKTIWIALVSCCMTACNKGPATGHSQTNPTDESKRATVAARNETVPAAQSNALQPPKESPPAEMKTFSIKEIAPSTVEVTSSMMTGNGTRSEESVEDLRRDKTGSMTISQESDGRFIFKTDQPEDKFYFEMKSFMMKFIVPSGDGATFRFVGTVKDFYKGYTFTADGTEPLIFTLSKAEGLMFVSGKGSVQMPDGRTVKLSRASTVKSP